MTRVTCALAAAFLWAAAAEAQAQVLHWQAFLTNARGDPLSGSYDMKFELYDAPSGGELVWTSGVVTGIAQDGQLVVALPQPPPRLFASGTVHLAVTLGAEAFPERQPVGAVPVALFARDADAVAGRTVSLAGCAQGQVLTYADSVWACGPAGMNYGCPSGKVLKSTGPAWECADDQTGSGPTYSAGDGLEKVDSTFSLLQSCTQGQVLKRTDSMWDCAADDPGPTYDVKLGGGLAVDGSNNFALAPCGQNMVLKSTGPGWACGNDIVGTGGGTYSSGPGLDLFDNVFSIQPCTSPNEVLRWDGSDWVCRGAAAAGSNADITALTGLTTPLTVAQGGTGADLDGAGGTGQFVKKLGPTSPLSVGAILSTELPSHTHQASEIASGTLAVGQGGTGSASAGAAGSVAYSNGSAYGFSAAGSAGELLKSEGTGAPTWGAVDLASATQTTGTLPIARGGTGAVTAGAALDNLGALKLGAINKLAAGPAFVVQAELGQATPLTEWQDDLGAPIAGVTAAGNIGAESFTAFSPFDGFSGNGSQLNNLNASNLTAGTVSPARGGTGIDTSSGAAGSILVRDPSGTAWGTLPPGLDGDVLQISTGLPSWGAAPGGSGTVTSIATGVGLTSSPTTPITTSGTISVDFTGSTGTTDTVARSNHTHGLTCTTVISSTSSATCSSGQAIGGGCDCTTAGSVNLSRPLLNNAWECLCTAGTVKNSYVRCCPTQL